MKDFLQHKVIGILACFMLILGIWGLATYAAQDTFREILVWFGICFVAYFLLLYHGLKAEYFKLLLVVGIICRLIALFIFPQLSDDIFRFIWDGELLHNGMNPYHYLPSLLAEEGFRPDLFALLNSQEYYTIYPPCSQLVFYLSGFAKGIITQTIVMKALLMVGELIGFYFLVKLLTAMQKERMVSFIYFLNPLVIIEGVGNVHFEILMLSFFIAALYYAKLGKWRVSALLYALSIGTKLIPLMFLPFFLFALKGKERMEFLLTLGISLLIIFSPILIGLDVVKFGASLDLYFQKFEFNASVYYLLRFIGELVSGYNLILYIGPLCAITVIFYIVKESLKAKSFTVESFTRFAFISFTIYLWFATTVHPWYLCTIIILSCFMTYRYAIVWSALVVLSYINYSYTPYWENLYVIAFEYVFLGLWMTYETGYLKKIVRVGT